MMVRYEPEAEGDLGGGSGLIFRDVPYCLEFPKPAAPTSGSGVVVV